MKTVLDVEHLIAPDQLAREISNRWHNWNSARTPWKEEKKELRNYLYATDTRTTSNRKLPWSNSTTTPKLTQVYDNLKANYSAALFPNSKWMRWEDHGFNADNAEKRKIIQAYMENKVRQGKFMDIVDTTVDDFILYGNCFGTIEFVREIREGPDGESVTGYVGPKLVRISPYDIVFDPTAASFDSSPKIVRVLTSLGELKKRINEGETYLQEVFDKVVYNRVQSASYDKLDKQDGFVADGFGSLSEYYSSNFVEILTFYGDIYNADTGDIQTGRKITVIDRAYVVANEPIASWLGNTPIFHAGWRDRPDNLYAMGPLDNLVGLQYRIDHLENLKADVFDQIALPMLKIRGDVEDFDYAPGGRVYMGDEGDVAPLVPDATALQADLQIQLLENKMEEMAGAPRQAMGIRTPGEKTAFEVQTLQNSASRIFQHKASKFEQEFIEPVLNAMLESARRNMDMADSIKIFDEELAATLYRTITREDIVAKGKIVPIGARHFAERATRVQNINQLMQIKASDPSVGVHLSGKKIAELLAYEIGEEKLYEENVALKEQAQTQEAMMDQEADTLETMEVKAEKGL